MAAPSAIVLLSGGLDSATALALAREEGFDTVALSFRYGQRHVVELDAARAVAAAAGVRDHLVLDLDLRPFGGSALTTDFPVPKHAGAASEAALPGAASPDTSSGASIPITYVPARNTIFLACALGLAEVRGSRDIFIGVNALDYSGYPDCRPEFIEAFERLAALATRAGVEGRPVRIRAPLLRWTKAEIIRQGLRLGVDFSLTRSCYDPDARGAACGACDSCRLRLRGFAEAGAADPAPYRSTLDRS